MGGTGKKREPPKKDGGRTAKPCRPKPAPTEDDD